MEKILSVSVAAYNAGNFLKKLIESITITEMIYEKIELIIVNDGSTDNTLELAKMYREKYPSLVIIIDKINGGYGSTINSAIKVATGKYFKLLDADDWFDSRNLGDFLEYLDKSTDDVVISPYEIVYQDTNTIEVVDRHQNGDYLLPLHMHEISVKTNLYKESNIAITEHCFYTDSEYAMHVMDICSQISKFPKPIYCYRIGQDGQSVSEEGRIKHIADGEKVVFKCIDKFAREGINTKENIKMQLIISTIFHYKSLALLPKKNSVSEIRKFDGRLKRTNKLVYDWVGENSRSIRLFRLMKFHPSFFVIKIFRNR